MKCPQCGEELNDNGYCYSCMEFFNESDDYESDRFQQDDFEEVNYDSMVNNGDAICLNCTFWSVSPYGASYGMICRRGNMTDGPGDSCFEFVQEHHFANYGDGGQYQFNETERAISNKLHHWKNSR